MPAPLKFQVAGPREHIAWSRRGAYLLRDEGSGDWSMSFMPQLSAKNPKPTFSRIGSTYPSQRDAMVAAQQHLASPLPRKVKGKS